MAVTNPRGVNDAQCRTEYCGVGNFYIIEIEKCDGGKALNSEFPSYYCVRGFQFLTIIRASIVYKQHSQLKGINQSFQLDYINDEN